MYATADLHRTRRRRPEPGWKSPLRQLAMGAAVFVFLAIAFAQAVHGSSPGGYVTVTVRPGDSLWSIAAGRYPGSDAREKVGEIMAANGLRDPSIRAGQELRVPAE